MDQWLIDVEQGETEEIKGKPYSNDFVHYECHMKSPWVKVGALRARS
jgi:hypothetical protein